MKEWQFNVLFFVGVGSAILLLLGPQFGLDVSKNPTAVTGVGAILTYVLTQRMSFVRNSDKKKKDEEAGNKSDESETKVMDRKKNERGFMRYPLIADLALLTVVAITVWAAVQSQEASNKVQQQQNEIDASTLCTQQFLGKTIETLDKVTLPSRTQAANNVVLQKAQSKFLKTLIGPPPATDEQGAAALREYVQALSIYVASGNDYKEKAAKNPFPTPEEFRSCLEQSK